ncbi:hypothetical protein ABXS71_20380 [Bacillus infantis]|uniref:hypothetical protein n=1 Tax=Bacillus infantis TaxID=324767 RepID=UPI00344EC577
MWKIGNLAAGRGEKVKGYLEFPGIQEKLPAFLINGAEDGPATLILGGIHGCEYTSKMLLWSSAEIYQLRM